MLDSGSDNQNESLSSKGYIRPVSGRDSRVFLAKDVREAVQKLKDIIKWLEVEWEISKENYECYDDWIEFIKEIDSIFGEKLI